MKNLILLATSALILLSGISANAEDEGEEGTETTEQLVDYSKRATDALSNSNIKFLSVVNGADLSSEAALVHGQITVDATAAGLGRFRFAREYVDFNLGILIFRLTLLDDQNRAQSETVSIKVNMYQSMQLIERNLSQNLKDALADKTNPASIVAANAKLVQLVAGLVMSYTSHRLNLWIEEKISSNAEVSIGGAGPEVSIFEKPLRDARQFHVAMVKQASDFIVAAVKN